MSATQAADEHEGGAGGAGVLPLTQPNWTLLLCVQPPATSAAVLNQQLEPDSTPAAQPSFASQRAQHCSFVVAGAESREPCP